jgi:uncharacterized heparinase superfamily protein
MIALRDLPRLFRTLRPVPPAMMLARVAYRLRCLYYASPLYGLRTALRGVAPFALKLVPPDLWGGDAAHGKLVAAGRYHAVGHTLVLGSEGKPMPRNWFPPQATALWVFHLHYHDWLGDLRAAGDLVTARRVLVDWMETCGHWHPVAWHPYPLSLRLVNWLTHGAWVLANEETEGWDEEAAGAFRELVLVQAKHLAANCEVWLGGNHLIKNLKALVYAGACLPGQEALLVQGLSDLLRELPRQVHADGGQVEASPWYQAQVLADVVDVAALLRKAGGVPPRLQETMERMAAALATYRHTDGGLALFNDGAAGEVAYLDKVLKRAGDAEPLVHLPETGYVRMVRGPSVVLVDAGKVGPDENPGHAHADMLSFEWSLDGKRGAERVVVNGGTYAYQHRQRNQFRGTATHSTVTVDGTDSAEVWGVFRVGRRPRDVGATIRNPSEGDMAVQGWHDGYRHKGVLHQRTWVLADDGKTLRGEDMVTFARGWRLWRKPPAKVVARFHLAPGCACRLVSDDLAEITTARGRTIQLRARGGRMDVQDGQYAAQFGVLEGIKVLAIHGRGGPLCKLEWIFRIM